jgi:hypothetical protein
LDFSEWRAWISISVDIVLVLAIRIVNGSSVVVSLGLVGERGQSYLMIDGHSLCLLAGANRQANVREQHAARSS